MQHWVPSTHFRTESRCGMSPDPRTGQSPNKSQPAVTSQNSAQQPDNCNMVTWSVLNESNTHIAKRALEASTDAHSPENAPRSLHIFAQPKCIPLIRFHRTAMRNTRFTAVTDPMISIIANYTLTLETFIFRVQSQVIVRMKVCKTNPSAPA